MWQFKSESKRSRSVNPSSCHFDEPHGRRSNPGFTHAIDRNTRALTNMQLTAGRGEIRVAMEPQLGGALA